MIFAKKPPGHEVFYTNLFLCALVSSWLIFLVHPVWECNVESQLFPVGLLNQSRYCIALKAFSIVNGDKATAC